MTGTAVCNVNRPCGGPGEALPPPLAAFNVGVEIGQVAVLLVLVPALGLVFRYVVPERLGIIILSALVAHTAWHWMTERFDRLRQFNAPALDAALAAGALRWLIAVVAVAGVLEQISFKEGSEVKQGQTLFTIQREEYAAALETTRAQMAKASPAANRASPTPARHGSEFSPWPRNAPTRINTITRTKIAARMRNSRDHGTRPLFVEKAATSQ
jgi:hypothetical protein